MNDKIPLVNSECTKESHILAMGEWLCCSQPQLPHLKIIRAVASRGLQKPTLASNHGCAMLRPILAPCLGEINHLSTKQHAKRKTSAPTK